MNTSCRRAVRVALLICVLLLVRQVSALAGSGRYAYTPSIDDWGETGLLEIPNARFEPDGTFDLGANFTYPYYRYYITAEILPWLQGTIRYLNIRNRLYGLVSFSGHKTYLDRSFGLKIRLVKEGRYNPQIALGIRDIAGTSLISGEYVTLSRRYYDWDFTLGFGWGYLGTRGGLPNPFGLLSSSFKSRVPSRAGAVHLSYFHGPEVSPFGGVEYLTPIKGLRLKFEYDGNDYQQEPLGNRFAVRWPVNFGFDYQLPYGLALAGGFERGNTLMLQVNLQTNLNSSGVPRLDLPPPSVGSDPGAKASPAAPPTALPIHPIPVSVSKPRGVHAIPPGPRVRTLYATFAHLGIHALSVTFRRQEVVVSLDASKVPPPDWALTKAAWTISHLRLAGPVETVTYVAQRHHRSLARTSFAISDIAQSIRLADSPIALVPTPGRAWRKAFPSRPSARNAAGNMFSVLARHGLGHSALALHGTHAIVTNRQSRLPKGASLEETAEDLAVAAAPEVTIDSVTFVGRNASGRSVHETFSTRAILELTSAPARDTTPGRQIHIAEAARRIFAALRRQGLRGEHFSVQHRRATLYFSQDKYFAATQAIGRAARILAYYAPPNVLELSLVETKNGLPVTRVTMLRQDLVKAAHYEGSVDEIWEHTGFTPASYPNAASGIRAPHAYPNWTWSIMPRIRDQIGGPNGFFFYQVWMNGQGELRLAPGLSITGSAGANIYNNYGNLILASNSSLPHVRSDIAKYLKGANVWIDELHGDYLFKFAPNWYGRVSAGIFELMFGGVDGEVLYRPLGKTWAIGADLNHVWQRDFNGGFGFQSYAVTTGHVTWYQHLPGHVLMKLSFGRYLAGDIGGTLDLSRTFKSGIRLGAFITKTNVSAAQFGEGSFDKGVYIQIPLDLLLGAPSSETADLLYRPLTRDGGQMLDIPDPLYDVTDPLSERSIARNWGDLLR